MTANPYPSTPSHLAFAPATQGAIMSVTLKKITPRQHRSAITWVEEAFADNPVGWASALTPQQVYRVVQRHYDGGWQGFLTDLGTSTWR